MAGENFCVEVLEQLRKDANLGLTGVYREVSDAIEAAERADHKESMAWLDQAQVRISKLRNVLQDLADERERQIDKEGEQ